MGEEETKNNKVSLAYNYQDEKGQNFNCSVTIESNNSHKELLADATKTLDDHMDKVLKPQETSKAKPNGNGTNDHMFR